MDKDADHDDGNVDDCDGCTSRCRLHSPLCGDGVNEGDWEKAFRVVAIYLGRMRPHLEAEERRLVSPELADVEAERIDPVAASFAALEEDELGVGGRLEYFDITCSLCKDVGIDPPSNSERRSL